MRNRAATALAASARKQMEFNTISEVLGICEKHNKKIIIILKPKGENFFMFFRECTD